MTDQMIIEAPDDSPTSRSSGQAAKLKVRYLLFNRFDCKTNNRKDTDMRSQILGLRVASAIFGLMTLAQVARLVIRPEMLVAGHLVPLWPSALAVVILGSLCLWLWKLSALHPHEKGQSHNP
jgi:hypothetical protein